MSEPPPPGFAPAPPTPVAPAPAARPLGRASWSPWLAPAAFVTGFGVTIVIAGIVFAIAAAAGVSQADETPGINIGLTLVQNVALVVAAYAFAALSGARPAAGDFGLRRTRLVSSAGWLVVAWIAFFALAALWAALVDVSEQQDLPEELGADGSLVNALAVIALVTVVAPLGEELFFRGFFFGALRNWHGPLLAAILTGVVFGGIHLGSSPIGYIVPLMVFGAILCLLYERTGSLYPPIVLHSLNNCIALGANLDYSWQIPVMLALAPPVALLCAAGLARAIGDGGRAADASAPAPGVV